MSGVREVSGTRRRRYRHRTGQRGGSGPDRDRGLLICHPGTVTPKGTKDRDPERGTRLDDRRGESRVGGGESRVDEVSTGTGRRGTRTVRVTQGGPVSGRTNRREDDQFVGKDDPK